MGSGHVEQPMPVRNGRPSVQSMVRADLGTMARLGPARWSVAADVQAREQVGIERYQTSLQAFNGRDCLRDAYEECVDGVVYLRQAIEEAPARGWDVTALKALYGRALAMACAVREFRDGTDG